MCSKVQKRVLHTQAPAHIVGEFRRKSVAQYAHGYMHTAITQNRLELIMLHAYIGVRAAHARTVLLAARVPNQL